MTKTTNKLWVSQFISAVVLLIALVGNVAAQDRFSPPDPSNSAEEVFNQLFFVGQVGGNIDTRGGNFRGSLGCGATSADQGGSGGTSLSAVLNEAQGLAPDFLDNREIGSSGQRSAGRDLWRFCDHLYNGGAWSTFYIDADQEAFQSRSFAPAEIFAQIDQAATLVRAQLQGAGRRVAQRRVAALGLSIEDGVVVAENTFPGLSIGSDGTLTMDSGLNGGDGTAGSIGIFGNVRFINVEADATPAQSGSETDGYGFQGGLDYMFTDTFVGGFSIGYTDLDSDFDAIRDPTSQTDFSPGSSEITDTSVQFFFSYFPSETFTLSGVAGFSSLEFENTKTVPALPSVNPMNPGEEAPFDDLISDPDGDTTFVSLNLSYDKRLGENQKNLLSTYARVEYLKTEIDGFEERSVDPDGDDTLALTVSGQDNTSLTGVLGATLSFPINAQSGVWLPYARLEYVHEFDDQADDISGFLTIIPEAQFTILADGTDEDYGYGALGLIGQFQNSWSAFVEYESIIGYEDLTSWQVQAGFRKQF